MTTFTRYREPRAFPLRWLPMLGALALLDGCKAGTDPDVLIGDPGATECPAPDVAAKTPGTDGPPYEPKLRQLEVSYDGAVLTFRGLLDRDPATLLYQVGLDTDQDDVTGILAGGYELVSDAYTLELLSVVDEFAPLVPTGQYGELDTTGRRFEFVVPVGDNALDWTLYLHTEGGANTTQVSGTATAPVALLR